MTFRRRFQAVEETDLMLFHVNDDFGPVVDRGDFDVNRNYSVTKLENIHRYRGNTISPLVMM